MKANDHQSTDGETLEDPPADGSGVLPRGIRSPQAKLVYLSLELSDGATIGELEDRLALKKITLLCVLDSLAERKFVERTGPGYTIA